jgi:hypothetical protein
VVSLCALIVHREAGHFGYALDDPYIHLALAENLAHGHFGINPAEYSSPSSSLLWPFLLIPFAGTALHVFVPLFWNVLFGALAAYLLGWVVERWPPAAGMKFLPMFLTAVLLMFCANLFSLTIVGMEHVLQILLSIACGIALLEVLSGREIPLWCLIAAAIAPSVRYEDLSITAAVCLALAGQRHWRKATSLFTLSVLPLIAFSAFLHSRGMPLLPMSVLAKGGAYIQGTAVQKAIFLIECNLSDSVLESNRYAILLFGGLFAVLAFREKLRVRRFVFAGAALLAALQILIGRFNWFNRYEVYAVLFLTLLAMRVFSEWPRYLIAFYAIATAFCAIPYIEGTWLTPGASLDVYRQQFQMHRFVTEFYSGNYAVNDLGLVSFERRPGAYVLDLYGLASAEALRVRNKPAAWTEQAARRHNADLAMLYPTWFHIPESWTPLARLCMPGNVVASESCMVFYSTNPSATAAIRAELLQFGKTLPKDDTFEMDPPRSDDSLVIPQ